MSWKRFWFFTGLSLAILVVVGIAVIQAAGGTDNPNLICDLAIRHSDC